MGDLDSDLRLGIAALGQGGTVMTHTRELRDKVTAVCELLGFSSDADFTLDVYGGKAQLIVPVRDEDGSVAVRNHVRISAVYEVLLEGEEDEGVIEQAD